MLLVALMAGARRNSMEVIPLRCRHLIRNLYIHEHDDTRTFVRPIDAVRNVDKGLQKFVRILCENPLPDPFAT